MVKYLKLKTSKSICVHPCAHASQERRIERGSPRGEGRRWEGGQWDASTKTYGDAFTKAC